jgi:hypothetical protein
LNLPLLAAAVALSNFTNQSHIYESTMASTTAAVVIQDLSKAYKKQASKHLIGAILADQLEDHLCGCDP